MPGLYIHIPFCQSRCLYCDFYSTTLHALRDRYVDALCKEMQQRSGTFATVYIGGGTPSQLTPQQLDRLFAALHLYNKVEDGAEVTMECNPDDCSPTRLQHLRRLGINRLSLGIQTFDDDLLRFLRRRHTGEQAIRVVREAQDVGFRNISIDLMFGFPFGTLCHSTDAARTAFAADLTTALSLDVQHLSAYSLMYEEGTPLTRLRDKGEVEECDEETSLALYQMLIDRAAEAGFEHYEISNFARPGFRSRHNASYWDGTPYTGLGAGAHSYDGHVRRWNHPDLALYIESIESGAWNKVYDSETLSATQQYNEHIMTRLRTCEGLDVNALRQDFGNTVADECLRTAHPHIAAGRLELRDHHLRLTRHGLFTSDDIMSDLFRLS